MFGIVHVLAFAVLMSGFSSLIVGMNAYSKGKAAGSAEVQQQWDAVAEAQRKAVEQATAEKIEAENRLAHQLQEQANALTAQIRSRDAAIRAARTELARLRDALATAAIGAREHASPAAAGPPADGAPADTGQLLGACAERLVELGEQADRLATQVVGLQDYARTAQRVCGPPQPKE